MKYIAIIFILISLQISAQQITIVDIITQYPIEGVSVSSIEDILSGLVHRIDKNTS